MHISEKGWVEIREDAHFYCGALTGLLCMGLYSAFYTLGGLALFFALLWVARIFYVLYKENK